MKGSKGQENKREEVKKLVPEIHREREREIRFVRKKRQTVESKQQKVMEECVIECNENCRPKRVVQRCLSHLEIVLGFL